MRDLVLSLLLLLLSLVPPGNSLNCSGGRAGNCYCSSTSQHAKYELFCPSYNPGEQKFTLFVTPGEFVKMTCNPDATMLDIIPNLKNLDIGNIKVFNVVNCPVPADPFAELMRTMGVMDVSKLQVLKFTQAPEPRNTAIQGYHFTNLSGLLQLELPRNYIKTVDKTMFTELAGLLSLDLTSNSGIQIDPLSFESLSLLEKFTCHSCYLTDLHPDLFAGLSNLRQLSLHDNKLQRLPDGIFRNQVQLRSLNLNRNRLTGFPENIFGNTKNLSDIMLSYNYFKTMPNDLFSNCKNLKKFTMLVNNGGCFPNRGCDETNVKWLTLPPTMFNGSSIEEIKMLHVPITEIPATLFKGVTSLVNLTIQNSLITSLPENLFKDTKNIKLIDFSGNNMKNNVLPEGLFSGLQKVETLRFIKTNLIRIYASQFESLRKLKVLHFQENQIADIPYQTFTHNRQLEKLDLSSNNLSLSLNLGFTKGQVFEKLTELDLSNNRWTAIPSELQHNFLGMKVLNLSHNLIGEDGGGQLKAGDLLQFLQKNIVVDLSHNQIQWFDLRKPQYNISNQNPSGNLKINLTGNPIVCDCIATELKQKQENTLSNGFHNKFELVNSKLQCVETLPNNTQIKGKLLKNVNYKDLVCPFPSSKIDIKCTDKCHCSVNRYYQETLIDCSDLGMTEFPSSLVLVPSPWSTTIRLDMSGNMITDLSKAVAKYYGNNTGTNANHYSRISHLYLTDNEITNFHQECLPPNLTELFLNKNQISGFEQTDINYFDSLVNRTNLELRLGSNPYTCDCTNRPLYHFIKNRGSRVTDLEEVEMECGDKTFMVWKAQVEEFCRIGPPLAVIMSVVIIVIALLLICILLVVYSCHKDTIVIWVYSKSWSRVFFSEDMIDKEKPYDAFLSYSHMDADFVEQTLLQGLELPENNAHRYKCLIHTRDWNVGEMIPDQILHSVESSRRTIIILSKSYIEAMWTKLEFRAAHTQALQDKTQRVIIIVRGELPSAESMEEDLQKYINMNTYLDSEDPWFWPKLRYALPHRGSSWSQKRTRRETDKMELMRSTAELEMGKQSRTPSPETLNAKSLMPNKGMNISNGHASKTNGHVYT